MKKIFLFLLIFYLALSYSADYKEEKKSSFIKTFNSGWISLATDAILISFFFNILLYMVSVILQSEELKRFAKSEFIQATASSFMIFFAVTLLFELSVGGTSPATISIFDFMQDIIGKRSYVTCGAMPDGKFNIWTGNKEFGAGPLGAFKCKLQEKISSLEKAYAQVYNNNKPREQLASTCFYFLGFPVWCGDWDRSIHNQVEEYHLIATKIVGLLIPFHALYSLANFVDKNMLSVFLPLGLILRIFPFTRSVGGLFIAIAIGFFFVWPTFFVLTDPTFVKASDEDLPTVERKPTECFAGFKGTSILLQRLIGEGQLISSEGLASINEGKQLVFQLTISIMFYPFVAFIITLIFIRTATPILGGDLGDLMRVVGRLV